jgi:hypothetical protein
MTIIAVITVIMFLHPDREHPSVKKKRLATQEAERSPLPL